MANKIPTQAQWEDLAARIKAKANASDIPTSAADVHALPDTTKYGADLNFSMNSSTFVVTAQLKDQDGNNLGSAKTIDLPLESMVVDGDYDSATKEVVLTLKSGTEVRFSVADLVSGLQTEITSTNKLSADLVEATTNNQFVTTTQKNKLNNIEAGAQVNKIETIQRNGTALTITGKTVNIAVPTKTSDLTNDSNFLTSIPKASSSVLGGIKVGSGLSIANDGTLTATGTPMKLYSTTGQNTDGAMTQKAVTDNLPSEFSSSEWNALWA